jgi:hypothetical protein
MAKAQIIDFLLSGYRTNATDLPLVGGTVEVYAAGTSNVAYVWDDRDKTLPTTTGRSTITLDIYGRAEVYGAGIYKFVIKDFAGAAVETIDYAEYETLDFGGVSTVETIAALRDLPIAGLGAGATVQPLGYYDIGDGGGGHARYLKTGAAPGTYVDDGWATLVPTGGDGSAAWVCVSLSQVIPQWLGALGAGDDTIPLQAAIDYAIANKLPLNQTINHTANVTLAGAINWNANGHALTPAVNAAVITLNAGSTRTVIDNLEMVLGAVDRAWTACDGILIIGAGGSEDYTTLRNLLIRGAPGYGLYAYGSSTSGNTVQRLHVYDSTFVDSGYANVRLEGVVLESQWHGCFFNDGCNLGALPLTTDQTTHPASPAREFRRGSVELLRWYTAADTATNDLTPNRVLFNGCNFANNEDNIGTSRTAGLYVSAGVSITVDTTNFENPFPAIWLAREGGTTANYRTSSRGFKSSNCTFKSSITDLNVAHSFIEWDGFGQVILDNPMINGDGSPVSRSFLNNNLNYSYGGLLQVRNPQFSGTTFTDGFISREAAAYCPTRLIASGRYMAYLAGIDGVIVGKATAAHPLDALTSVYNSLNTAFPDDLEISLSCDTAINGALTVNHDSDDGAAGVLAGKFALVGAVAATLDADWKKIRLKWDAPNQIWRELYRNF